MWGIAVRNPRLNDGQRIRELKTPIFFKIIGCLFISLGLLTLISLLFYGLVNPMPSGGGLILLGLGLYFYNFKPSYSSWWVKIFKAFGIFLLMGLSINFVNLIGLLLWIILVFIHLPLTRQKYEEKAYKHNKKMREKAGLPPLVTSVKTVKFINESDNGEVVYGEEEITL